MPRLPRLDATGILHHVMISGIERRKIFKDDKVVSDISALNNYTDSGYSALMGRKRYQWQDTEYIFRSFGKNVREGKKRYLGFIKAGISQGHRNDLAGGA